MRPRNAPRLVWIGACSSTRPETLPGTFEEPHWAKIEVQPAPPLPSLILVRPREGCPWHALLRQDVGERGKAVRRVGRAWGASAEFRDGAHCPRASHPRKLTCPGSCHPVPDLLPSTSKKMELAPPPITCQVSVCIPELPGRYSNNWPVTLLIRKSRKIVWVGPQIKWSG